MRKLFVKNRGERTIDSHMKKRLRKRTPTRKKASGRLPSALSSDVSLLEQKCKNLFDLTSDLIQIFKVDGTIIEVNASWRITLEYDERDLANLTVYNLLLPKYRMECEEIFLAVLRDGRPRKFQGSMITKSGQEIAVEGTVSRLLCEDRPCALSAIFDDVTRHKHYEKLKDEFISTVSHELRTPLTVIREGVSQVRDELMGPVAESQKTMLDMVLQNSDRLGRIIEEILDVSRLEAGRVRLHRKLCNIVDVIKEVVGNFKAIIKRKDLELLTDFPSDTIEIYIDRDKIVQIFTNLITNSLRFTEKGRITVRLRSQEDFVECSVSDTGRGISKEDLAKAFNKFSQFAREIGPGDRGTGLGLAICKRLVELHHGRAKIESVPLKGTTVSFVLPRYTHRELFKNSIVGALSRCVEEGGHLSIIIFDVLDFEMLEKRLGFRQMENIVVQLEKLINGALRRVADVAIKDTKAIMVLLPDTHKDNAHVVMGRLLQVVEDYLIREKKLPKMEVHGSVVCYPEEAVTLEEILDRIYA